MRAYADCHAERSGAGGRPRTGAGGGRDRVSDQAVLSAGAPHPCSVARAQGASVAGTVGLSQALSYARDLKSAYETARARECELMEANDRLLRGYQQSLQYAVDLKKTYRRLER